MLWPKAPLPSGLRSRAGSDTAFRSGAGLIPRTFGPARGHPSGSPASFRCPLTRCRAPVQQALAEDARWCVLDVLPENVRRQPPGHVRRRRGGA